MLHVFISSVAIVLGCLLINASAHSGAIYKCKDASGKISYSESLCHNSDPVDSFTKDPVKTGHKLVGDKNEPTQMPEKTSLLDFRELQGKWTDLKNNSPFSSYWNFDGAYLQFQKYSGFTFIKKYDLKGNLLTIHHEPDEFRKEPYDEELEITSYDGDTLTWEGITTVKLYRVY